MARQKVAKFDIGPAVKPQPWTFSFILEGGEKIELEMDRTNLDRFANLLSKSIIAMDEAAKKA